MTTGTKAILAHEAIAAEEPRSGLFDRAFRRVIAAREARARAIVNQHLAHLSEERLLDLGFEPQEIKKLRASAGATPLYWD